MDQTLLVTLLSTLGAAIWSVWTWRDQQEKERNLKRDQESALFVNSFIQALQELQARLYGVLAEDDLAFFQKEYPGHYELGSPLAIEFLYRLSKCFGWGYYTYRYGAYINDPVVIELVRKMGETMESRSKFPGDAFRFTYEERIALGESVVQRTEDKMGSIPVFESITLYQFQAEMEDDASKYHKLFQSRAVRRTLAAMDAAKEGEPLEGAERLSVLQNLLVDLLTYLESMEGFSVCPEERRKVPLRGAAAEAAMSPVAAEATVVHQIPGRIRIKVPRLKTDAALAPRVYSLLKSMDNVASIRLNTATASVVIGCSPEIPVGEFARKLARSIETGVPAA